MRLAVECRSLVAVLAATTALALMQPAHAQLRGTLEQSDALADSFDDPPLADPDADPDDADTAGAILLPEDREEELIGQLGAENDRLVPAQPGDAVEPARPPRATRARPAPQVGTPQTDGSTIPRANVPASSVQGGALDPNRPGPYDPLGVRLGPLRVTTSVEQSLGSTSNADFSANGQGATFSQTRFALDAVSDLSVHELRGSVRGSFQKFLSGDAEDLPTLDAEGSFRYDLRRDTTLTVGANWSVATESATDDSLTGLTRPIEGRPRVQQGALSLEAARTGGRFFGSLRGSIGREIYQDIEFADGTSRSQADREATLFEAALRVGYAHTPALQPFAEIELGYRAHDENEDFAGQNRNAARYALRGGVQVDLAETLSGELAAGVETVIYDSGNLEDIVAPSLSAALTWSPDRLTRVALQAETVFDDSVTAGVGGSLDYRIAATATRDIRENLDLFGTLSLNLGDPGGTSEETTYAAELGLAWNINRALAVTGRVNYSRVESVLENASYDVKSASIGLRWQR